MRLGYLVEKISGASFIEYINKNIFQPLNMRRSTFLQPPPAPLTNDLAVGYQYQNGKYQAVPYLYLNIAPAAAMSTTATDMANFMIAHLLQGRYENSRILEPDTVRLMHQTHFSEHPKLPGTGYSFRERLENNIRMIGHLGSLRGYSSSLSLMPNRNIGIFIATNSYSGIHGTFLTKFLDRYFPAPNNEPIKPLSLNNSQLERFTGTYRDMEYPRHTLAKLTSPFKHIIINKGNNGDLVINTPSLLFPGSVPKIQLIPVEPMLFKRADSDAFTSFGEENGRIAFAFNPLWPKIGAYERVYWYETVWVQLGIAAFCAIVFLSACIVWPIGYIFNFIRGQASLNRQKNTFAWVIAGVLGTLNLVFLIGLPLSLWLTGWKLAYGVPTIVLALLCLPLITSILSLVLLVFTILVWKNNYWSWMTRTHYSLITLAALIFIPFLAYWNLLGFQI
ncbi:hypothetical protein CAL7716_027490 [Calothrix sp. PCC 7716]|nr:hypothetical protein CAL7716_027490 [Calothrix sp. PCC 7716]